MIYSDGGGKRAAALNPIYGKDKILRFLVGRLDQEARRVPRDRASSATTINGLPGFVFHTRRGRRDAVARHRGRRDRRDLRIRNPDKLRHLA